MTMKSTSRVLLVSIVSILAVHAAYSQIPDYVFNITPEDEKFVRYNLVVNQFDTATIGYEVGEIELGGGSTWARVNWKFISDNTKTEGSASTGPDYSLAAVMESEVFEYDDEDTVRFYRMAYVYNEGCDPDKGPSSGGSGDGSGSGGTWNEDDWWSTITGAISDRSEFLLEVVESSSGDVKFVADSIRIDSNSSSSIVPHSGSSPHALLHKIEVTGLTDGVDYFFRIRPNRHGSTAYGMMCSQYGAWVTKSYTQERSGVSLLRLSSSAMEDLHDDYVDSALAWIDVEYNATGIVPSTWSMTLGGDANDTIVDRYFDSVLVGGIWRLEEKPLPALTTVIENRIPSSRVGDGPPIMFTTSLYPNPASLLVEKFVSFRNVRYNAIIQARIVDVTGRTVSRFDFNVGPASGDASFPIAVPARGTFFVLLYDRNQRFLAKHTLVVID